MRPFPKISCLIVWATVAATALAAPQYQIFDLGTVQVKDLHSTGYNVSPAGMAVGSSGTGNGSQAFTWTQGGGLGALPVLSGRNYTIATSANDNSIVVGNAFNTGAGGTWLPVVWQNGVISQLPLPGSVTTGQVQDVNASGIAVGSAGKGGEWENAAIYSVAGSSIITAPAPQGSQFAMAYGINDSGRIVGVGFLPSNPLIQLGIVYDMPTNTIFDVGTLPGANSTFALGVNNIGQVVGSSGRLPFIWTEGIGIVAIPLLPGTDRGDAQGVNSAGWVVGTDWLVNTAYSPFLYDGKTTHRLADLLPPGSGWVLNGYSPLSINDNGVIVGTGVHNGETHGYAMVPVTGTPTPAPTATPTATPSPTPTPTFAPSPSPSVKPPTARRFEVIAPSVVGQFQAFNFTVRAVNQFNQTAFNYTGTVHFTSTSQGGLPPDSTLTNGFGTFSANLQTLGNHTITARDTVDFFLTGTSNTILVISDIVTPPPSPTPTPATPSPTPTPPPPTPTITPGQCSYVFLDENFDGVTAPALPPGWTSSFTPGPANCTPAGTCALGTEWTTSTTNPSSPPNCAFHDAPSCVTDSSLSSPTFHNGPNGTVLVFENNFALEAGRDGAVLEISINGGPFIDFVTAGGLFNAGGYTGTISTAFQSPIGGRQAWTGTSTGSLTVARMPDAAAVQDVVLRFRLVTDCSGAGTGQRIDNIQITYFVPCATPTPSPTATATGTPPPPPSPTATPTASLPPSPTPTPSATPSPTPPIQALNLSTRLRVQTGDNVGIGGFIITGSAPKYLLFRGIGPSLTALGITGALANPTLDLRRPDGTRILANNDWRETQEAEIQATGIPPTNDLEAAIVQTLDPGSYTIILRGMGMTTGVGLVEIYDLDQPAVSKLANISTRALVETGNSIVIAGFIVGGASGSDRMILRGIGPSLTGLGISNALADPTLQLRDGNGALLLANNNWQDDPAQAAELTNAGLAPSNQLESGIAMALSPGAYTALLAGANNGSGVGLVEVYDLGPP